MHGADFIDEYFLDHILSRGFEGFGHERPLWWFLEVIKVSFRIWIFPLIIGIFALPFVDKEKKQYVLVMLTVLITLVFFSVSKDKLIWYIVPIYPFLAIISARLIERGFTVGNSMLKADLRLTNEAVRLVGIFAVVIASLFYVVIERDMVYLDDFNKDKVALVKINNAMYPIEDNEDKKLYYNNISPPILLFYSDHQIEGVNIDKMLDVIDDSEPGQSQMFLIPEKLYYDVKTRQSEIEAPLVLELKGNAGGWTLVKSRSRVELLREEHNNLVAQVNPLKEKLLLKTITKAERGNLKGLTEQLDAVLAKLSAYGYGPN